MTLTFLLGQDSKVKQHERRLKKKLPAASSAEVIGNREEKVVDTRQVKIIRKIDLIL